MIETFFDSDFIIQTLNTGYTDVTMDYLKKQDFIASFELFYSALVEADFGLAVLTNRTGNIICVCYELHMFCLISIRFEKDCTKITYHNLDIDKISITTISHYSLDELKQAFSAITLMIGEHIANRDRNP